MWLLYLLFILYHRNGLSHLFELHHDNSPLQVLFLLLVLCLQYLNAFRFLPLWTYQVFFQVYQASDRFLSCLLILLHQKVKFLIDCSLNIRVILLRVTSRAPCIH